MRMYACNLSFFLSLFVSSVWAIFLTNFGEWRHSRDKWLLLLQAPNFCHSHTTRTSAFTFSFSFSSSILTIRPPLLPLTDGTFLLLLLGTYFFPLLLSLFLLLSKRITRPFFSLGCLCLSICIFTHFKLRWSATITACVLPVSLPVFSLETVYCLSTELNVLEFARCVLEQLRATVCAFAQSVTESFTLVCLTKQ